MKKIKEMLSKLYGKINYLSFGLFCVAFVPIAKKVEIYFSSSLQHWIFFLIILFIISFAIVWAWLVDKKIREILTSKVFKSYSYKRKKFVIYFSFVCSFICLATVFWPLSIVRSIAWLGYSGAIMQEIKKNINVEN